MKLPHPSKKHSLAFIFGLLLVYAPIFLLTFLLVRYGTNVNSLELSVAEVKKAQENFRLNLSEELFKEHLSLMEKNNLESKLTDLEIEIDQIRRTPEGSLVFEVNEAYELYEDFEAKVKRNELAGLNTESAVENLDDWGLMLIDQNFEGMKVSLERTINSLDEEHEKYLATLPPPPPPVSTGYTFTNIQTQKGSHGVYLIKLPLSEVRVKTVSASSESCSDNCPTKSLQDYVSENNAFAGMNGAYFCPPDYDNCSGKINSFDYALYNSNRGKWLNQKALSWNKTGLMTFRGNSPKFYKESSDYGGDSVDAGISNYPSLLRNGEVVVKDGDLTSYQKIKGTRGALGFSDENIYLAIISNATVEEAAYAMKALGADQALNLDGGGSSAMYVGDRYVVGPGRSLPSAVLLIK